MFISGAIGLVIFAGGAVTPPRLYAGDYMDTVTIRSVSYRLLQPPALINKYAAVPSLHFGWNLLVGVIWAKATTNPIVRAAAVAMPVAMAFAVVATANHWVADVFVGGAVATAGLLVQPYVRRWFVPATIIAVALALFSATTRRPRSHGQRNEQKEERPTKRTLNTVSARAGGDESQGERTQRWGAAR